MQFVSLHDVGLIGAGFLSELLGTISGFGSSTFFVPAALFFEKFQFVLALTALLHCFGNFFRILIFRENYDKKLLLKLSLPSILLTALGAWITEYVNVSFLERALGFSLVIISLLMLVLKKTHLKKVSDGTAVTLSGLSGFLTGFVGTGGAIRGLALAALQIPKNQFVLLSASIDILGDFTRAAIYVRHGFMDWSQWYYIPSLFVMAWAGARLGKMILARLDQSQFEMLVGLFVFISGLSLLIRS